MSARPAILVTGNDLAPQALALLADHEVVYAGKTPSEDDVVALCRQHDPVAIGDEGLRRAAAEPVGGSRDEDSHLAILCSRRSREK